MDPRRAATAMGQLGGGFPLYSGPIFSQLGTAAIINTAATVNVPFPAVVAANEVAFIQLATSTPVPVTSIDSWGGFTEVGQGGVAATDFYAGSSWFRCTGSEGGTSVTVTLGGVLALGVARMITFTQCKTSGTPYEALTALAQTSATVFGSALTTLGPQRLGVILAMVGRATAVGAMSNGWIEVSGSDTSGGSGNRLVAETQIAPKAITFGAGSVVASNDECLSHTFALLPV